MSTELLNPDMIFDDISRREVLEDQPLWSTLVRLDDIERLGAQAT